MLTPKEAAKHIGKSKATVLRHIGDGKLSASKNGSGNYQIDPSELIRVYGSDPHAPPHKVAHDAGRGSANEAPDRASDIKALRVELEAAEKLALEREKELSHRDRTIDDLRDRLTKEGEERRQLTAMLTDQRTEKRKGFLARLMGT